MQIVIKILMENVQKILFECHLILNFSSKVYLINLNVKTFEEYKFLIDLIFHINFITLKNSLDTATLEAKLIEKIKS